MMRDSIDHLLIRILSPLFLQVDFRHACWRATPESAHRWLLLGCVCEITLQVLSGSITTLSIIAALLGPLVFWRFPPRLASAVGSLSFTIATGGYLLLAGLLTLKTDQDVLKFFMYGWVAWSQVVLLLMFLKYVRTPKSEMPE